MSRAEPKPPSAEAVRERIHRRAAAIREREVERALAELESAGELTETQREIVEAFSRRLTERLLDPVEASLEREEAADVDACRRLFLRD